MNDPKESSEPVVTSTHVVEGITLEQLKPYQQTQRFWAQRSRMGAILSNASGPFFSLLPGKSRKERRAAWAKLRDHGNQQRALHNATTEEANVPHIVTSHWWRAMWIRAELEVPS